MLQLVVEDDCYIFRGPFSVSQIIEYCIDMMHRDTMPVEHFNLIYQITSVTHDEDELDKIQKILIKHEDFLKIKGKELEDYYGSDNS